MSFAAAAFTYAETLNGLKSEGFISPEDFQARPVCEMLTKT